MNEVVIKLVSTLLQKIFVLFFLHRDTNTFNDSPKAIFEFSKLLIRALHKGLRPNQAVIDWLFDATLKFCFC